MKKLAALLALACLCGCSSVSDKAAGELTYGMSKEEVIGIVGQPTRMLDDSKWYYAEDDGDFTLYFDADGKYERMEGGVQTPVEREEIMKRDQTQLQKVRESWKTQEGIRNYE